MLMGLGEIRVAPHLREVLGKLRIFHVWIKGRGGLHGLVQSMNAQTGYSPPKTRNFANARRQRFLGRQCSVSASAGTGLAFVRRSVNFCTNT